MSPATAAMLGRLLLGVGFVSLLGAWITQITDNALILGMTQQHLFNDAIVLTLLGIGSLVDAQLHRQKI